VAKWECAPGIPDPRSRPPAKPESSGPHFAGDAARMDLISTHTPVTTLSNVHRQWGDGDLVGDPTEARVN
jgi:hypothetical protein